MADKQEPYLYESMAAVPDSLKQQLAGMLSVAALSVAQVNEYVTLAYETQFLQGGSYIPDWGRAKAKFREMHEPIHGVWTKKE